MQTPVLPRHRRSIRLRDFDYRQAGFYFVTLCAHEQHNLFGRVTNDGLCLNWLGRLAAEYWQALPRHFAGVRIDGFVVMPNHLHGILQLLPAGESLAAAETFGCPRAGALATVVRSYKSAVTRRARQLTGDHAAAVWHRNYWDRVIRDETELTATRRYIDDNPLQWELDRLYRR